MKKLFTLAFLLASFSVFAGSPFKTQYSQPTEGTHKIVFTLGDFRITSGNFSDQTFSVINLGNNIVTNKKGFAALPFLHAAVQLPNTKDVDFSIEYGQYTDYQLNFPLLPSRGTITRDKNPANIPYIIDSKSITNSFYPKIGGYATTPYIMRDVRGTNVYVYPFRYNAYTQTLRVYKSLTVKLIENTKTTTNPLTHQNTKINREMSGIYSSVFINYKKNRNALTLADFGDIHIITTSRDETAILPYIQWKREKGFKVSIETVPAGTNVKTNVQVAYNANPNLLFVLLLGDWAEIQCDRNANNFAMDPQLGCVAGTDEIADLFIGRFSAKTAADITTQVDKTIAYEKNPDATGTWYKTAIGIGSDQGSGIGDDGEIDFNHQQNIWDNKLSQDNYTTYYNFYDPGASNSQLVTNWNAGAGIVNYTGHGAETTFVTTSFNNTNAAALTNGNMLPWVCCVGCNTGNYLYSGGDCLGEKLMKNPNGGAIVYLGATIFQPWAAPMRGQDYFMDILTGGYDYTAQATQTGISTTEQRTTSGAITYNGFVLMTTESNQLDDWNTVKTWIHFGDPSIQLRSKTPEAITASNTTVISGAPFTTTINGISGPIANAAVTISAGGQYFSAFTDAQGNVTINHTLTPGAAKLVVTAFNTTTIYQDINVTSPAGSYLVIESALVNGLQSLPFAQTGNIDITLKNVGVTASNPITATLTSADAYVSALTACTNIPYGSINPTNGTAVSSGNFTFTFANNVPDGHFATFHILLTDGSNTWEYDITIQATAPVLWLGNMTVDDSATGDNDGILDPGETANLMFATSNNGHADATNVITNISTLSPDITLAAMQTAPYNLANTASSNAVFTVTAANVAPGTNVPLNLSITGGVANQYSTASPYVLTIGFVPQYCPAGASGVDEFISNVTFSDINNSSVSGVAYNDYTSVVGNVRTGQTYPISVTNANHYSGDQIGFWADWNYDGDFDDANEFSVLNYVAITGTTTGIGTGNITIPANATIGNTRMRLRLMYTGTLSACGDASWGEVEDYTLAVANGSTINTEIIENEKLLIYPNPTKGILTIQMPSNKQNIIEIYNISGKRVFSAQNKSSKIKADLSQFASGIYYIKIISENKIFNQKIVKQ